MGFRINTNIGAANAHMSATMNNRELDNSLSRLSSGLRINKAADDASGMAIADSLRAQSKGLGQAIANANDGIAVAQTADGALDEYSNIIQTIRTKAIQASSDGQSTDSRGAIQRDINKLLEEAQNIASSTSFNGQKLLDGSFTNKSFHIGAYANETVGLSIASAQTTSVGAFAQKTGTATTTALGANDLLINGVDVGATTVDAKDQARAINSVSATTGVAATATTSLTGGAVVGGAILGTAVDSLTINGISIGGLTVQANDADGKLTAAINAIADQTGVTATLAAGKLTLTAADGRDIIVGEGSTAGGAAVAGLTAATTHGTLSLESDGAIAIGGAAAASAGLTAGTIAKTGSLAGANVGTSTQAENTIKITDHALKQIDTIRSNIGSVQNQLESTIRNISVTQVNVSSAESQIRDVDFAAESASFSKRNILSQSGSYAMSQANAVQQNVLRLLQ